MSWLYIILIIIVAYALYTYYVGQWTIDQVTNILNTPTPAQKLTIFITGTPATSMDTLFSNITVSSNSMTYLDSNYMMRNGIPMITITGDSFSVTINNSSGSLTGSKVTFANVTGDAATSGVTLADSKNYMYMLGNGTVVSM